MNTKHLFIGLAGIIGVAANASAADVTADLGSYSLTYDDSMVFGSLAYSFSSGGNEVGFVWTVPAAVNLALVGTSGTMSWDIPKFTITAHSDYALSGPLSGFFGNLVFNEMGSVTSVSATGKVSVDGSALVSIGGSLTKTVTVSNSSTGFSAGYFSGTSTAPWGNFMSLTVQDGAVILSIAGTGFGSIVGQPQNELKFSFFATPVPVPAAVWLLASALGGLATVSRRRA